MTGATTAEHPRSYRALIVDADPRWRAILAEIVSGEGWSIAAGVDAPDEIDGYDLAVLDVSPGTASQRAGLPLMERLAALGTPCVLLSGLSRAEVIAAAERQPRVLGYLTKDAFRRDELIRLIARAAALPAPAPPRVLVVEDEARWRAVYADILSDAGYVLVDAPSYAEARGWLQRGDFAVAIVDLHLLSSAAPDDNRDGFWFLRAAQQRGLPTIVSSALGEPDDIDRAYEEYGVFAFIEKEGFDRRAFARLVDEARRSTQRLAADPSTPEAAGAALLRDLTDRERDVLAQLVAGRTNREISEQLGITPNTVKKHVDHILQKLQVSSRAGAVAIAVKGGLT